MRIVAMLLLLCALAAAQGKRRAPTEEEVAKVTEIVGKEAWDLMAEWRRRDVVRRYRRFLAAPEKAQAAIREAGLKKYLTANRPSRGPKLPKELKEAIDAFDSSLQRDATKAAIVRVRQLRLDRNLSLIPFAKRRRWFERLFPEPFDPAAARDARRAFEKEVVQAIAAQLRTSLAAGAPETDQRRDRVSLVRRHLEASEAKVIEQVVAELRRWKDTAPAKPPAVELLLDRGTIFATPRQRELLRWAVDPNRCPLLDLSFLGERPDRGRARFEWDRDRMALGRMELLGRAGFPPDVLLHLSATGSQADFLRAARSLLGNAAGSPGKLPQKPR